MALLETVQKHIVIHQLIPQSAPLVVAVSGGADSLALLHILHILRDMLRIDIHVATFNHGWRESAQADVDFVRELAASWGLPVHVGQASQGTDKAPDEAGARRSRYDFLASVARKVGAAHVAVGHHRDDQAETVLLRVLRGTSLDGLVGMRWQRPLPYHAEFTLVRPLLGVSRAEIDDYCQHVNLTPRKDPTNDDIAYRRNWLRLRIMPQLQAMNPHIVPALTRLAESAAWDVDYLQHQTSTLLDAHATQHGHIWQLDRSAWEQWHPSMQRRTLVELVKRLYPNRTGDIDHVHVVAAHDMLMRGRQGAQSQFPDGVTVRIDYGNIVFARGAQRNGAILQCAKPIETPLPVQLNTRIALSGGAFGVYTEPPEGGECVCVIYFSQDATLAMRTRLAGDRVHPQGLNGRSQKLSDWMINHKLPAIHRAHVPLLMVNEVIAALVYPNMTTIYAPYHAYREEWCKYYLMVFLR